MNPPPPQHFGRIEQILAMVDGLMVHQEVETLEAIANAIGIGYEGNNQWVLSVLPCLSLACVVFRASSLVGGGGGWGVEVAMDGGAGRVDDILLAPEQSPAGVN